EDDDLGAPIGVIAVREGITERGNLVHERHALAVTPARFADEAGEQDRLPARHRDRTLDPALRNGRRQSAYTRGADVADFLLDIEHHVAVDVDPGNDPENHAGVAIVDGAEDLIAGIELGCGTDGYLDMVADSQRG